MKLEANAPLSLLAIVLTLAAAMGPVASIAEANERAQGQFQGSDNEAALPLKAEDSSEAQGLSASPRTGSSPVSSWLQDAENRAQAEVAQEARRQALERERAQAERRIQWFGALPLPAGFVVRNRIDADLLGRFDALGRPLTSSEQFDRDNLQRFDGLLRTTQTDEISEAEAPQTRHQLLQLMAARGQGGQQIDPYTRNSAQWLYWQSYGSPWVDHTSALSNAEGGSGPATRFLQQMKEREIPTYQTYGANELSAHFGEQSEASRLFQRYRNQMQTIRQAEQAEATWQNTSLTDGPIDYWNAWRGRSDLQQLNARRSQLEQEFLERAYLPGQDQRARN